MPINVLIKMWHQNSFRRQYLIFRNGEGCKDLAGPETSCMHGSFLRGNREAMYLSLSGCGKDRMENPKGKNYDERIQGVW